MCLILTPLNNLPVILVQGRVVHWFELVLFDWLFSGRVFGERVGELDWLGLVRALRLGWLEGLGLVLGRSMGVGVCDWGRVLA